MSDLGEDRVTCDRCRRPLSVCYCAHVPSLETRTRVVILQHPRERKMPIGTARMAHLGLPNSVLRVGLDFAADPLVQALMTDSTYVVFPGPSAVTVAELPTDRPINLVVLDGTWWQAGKLLKLNPAVASLPRVAFSPRNPSEYRIRRQPARYCLSTIEALVEVLDGLEPERGPFDRLLAPFRAMVSRQQTFQTEVRSSRHRKVDRPLLPSPTLAARLQLDWERVVCIQGEANAWPVKAPDDERDPPETVHWTAWRAATGETFSAVIAPRNRLAPSTAHHLGLESSALTTGLTVEEWRRRWEAFSRPGDLIVQWGTFCGQLSFGTDLPTPERAVDLRAEALHHLRRKVGAVEECLAALQATAPSLAVPGRAGRRLEAVVGVIKALWSLPRPPRDAATTRPAP